VPERPGRPRLVVADAAVDHDGVVRRLHDVALDAEHQLIVLIEEFRLQPAPVLVEQLFGDIREKFHRLEERTLLLDNAVDRGAADLDSCGQDGPPFSLSIQGAVRLGRGFTNVAGHVRCRGQSGKHILLASFPSFDSNRTSPSLLHVSCRRGTIPIHEPSNAPRELLDRDRDV
jgi:hypothetical protein